MSLGDWALLIRCFNAGAHGEAEANTDQNNDCGQIIQMYVILLTFNDSASALRCLQSIQVANYPELKVVVVDNASEDDTVAAIQHKFPKYQIIVNERNLGFGAGCNVGLRVALTKQAEFVMLINQDTVIANNLFHAFVEAAQACPQAGILTPKTYFLKKTDDKRERLLYGGSWRGRLPFQQRIPGIELVDDGSHEVPCQVDYAWGHGMFMRTAMLREIGLFDEDFFMYFEDMDLCRRASEAGYQICYIPQAQMWHDIEDGYRSSNPEPKRFQYKADSLLTIYKKHYGPWRGQILSDLHTLDEARQTWGRGQREAAKYSLQAWLHSLRV